ncbi:SDR family NAD(P)-dependent oxidoreductase [Lyngbya sp. CCY1209]|uniref:SDR family oxidoreductase n=1 Tax=Lyngbya sp. CCY1209 TaxID=2886103 RepID=UPI002D207592|nr:SDR family NAD(P)-dependent oxidoreductase [Lyngbya sp. CCY1209]MEB3885721.1 SDR family NAD(P)-dependent oxidoreductase [Lyngbya sp. CCY1209]
MGKTIVITGVSRGLGRALTENFIDWGHTVIGCARSEEAIANLQNKYGKPHDFTSLDVAENVAVKSWVTEFLKTHGAPDIVINNAALVNHLAPLWEVSQEEFDTLIDVNIKGVANVIRHGVPAMIERGSGIIINLSSGWGRSTSPEVAPYCASKWAIEGLTRSLAQELPPGLAAIPMSPGIIHTDMLETCFGGEAAAYTPIDEWVKKAVPFILGLTTKENGVPVSVPA